ncbi:MULTISPECIES: S28 family serine protease [unclassified Streptomyces]|uniref:S28 family serine protease n=1 Tax=unclassified Streptomyces TaxID=2593676 RepID=UPI002DDC2865|nr:MULTISPECIES: S28 family serine protease [unclassified Streptomyces]WSA94580.1 aminopeptidase [Streptomyces sp. NBC_01795]WSB79000.1 aminopeptidase [Streptomyces sp. NBC_01775]WSS12799.1 aminopeptidase [Streptomyces sp. NBC_01186]WSS41583.1 aminopeptidase [Streptomyces sp. NBC_01187]
MRKTLRWLLSLVVLISTVGIGSASAGAATTAAGTDIKDRILAVPGMSLIEEKPVDGYRYFVLNYEQPIDHRHPDKGTFKQRISILHKGEDRPTVFFTGGYNLNTNPSRSEPTQMTDGNQVSMEYRFFTPSRPDPADWSKLDIWQAASDQHRIFKALKKIYGKNWIATGGSKGGMTATYFRRFYPHDMDGTVAYVAPNDVRNAEDSAYGKFFKKVGSKECRAKLNGVQHEIFDRRGEMVSRIEKWAKENDYTFELAGSADKAFELVAQDLVWGFWQYHLESECDQVPATDASTDVLYKWADDIGGWDAGTDQGMLPYTPYYYQAGTQLGSPDYEEPLLDDVRKYPGLNVPRTYVPRDIPVKFNKHDKAMRDVDAWVRHDSSQMLFVYGQNDPWGAEPFRPGKGTKDTAVYTAPGQNHGANISKLEENDRAAATRALMKWADVKVDPNEKPKRLTAYDKKLDRPDKDALTLRP